ncbi:putative Type II secretion system protein F [uncultured Desulfobacterium sp.]|uniref:Putative Type II secretion system protein F n=1 Tax=uncultured Desulfobacterium sp. TaxID=201089 RepID=A0A445MVP0_9BACT|nr:putative Type II secretion system protein F [uncultured Desulfobacterium sp.]
MERFSYEAVDPKGRRIVASSEAQDRAALLLSLQARGMVLVRWLDDRGQGIRFFKRSGRTLNAAQLLQVTKDFAHLLKSGVTMEKTLTIMEEASKQEAVRSIARFLRESIQGGSTLSDAMAARPADFNNLYVNMVRVGEVGGMLPQVMEKLAQFMERSQEIKGVIVSSSIYPAILFFVGAVSVLVIMGFVVPRFAAIFSDLGQELPFSTRVLIEMSDFMRVWGWALLLSITGFIVMFWRIIHTAKGKEILDRTLIRTPFFGALIADIQISRFARTFGTMILSGVPLLRALTIVKDVVENNEVKEAVDHIHRQVKEGKRISVLMKEQEVFPAMAVQMVSLGEETGTLGEMLVLVADRLDNKIQAGIKASLALFEPATILFMGLVIGGIVVSMLSAIFGLNEIQF